MINMNLLRPSRFLGLIAPLAFLAACTQSGDPLPTPVGLGTSSSPIIGGTSDTADTFVVGIDVGGSAICSGTVISPSLVLTARHCVSKTPEALDCDPAGGLSTNKVLGNYAASSFRVTTSQYLYGSGASWSVRAVHYINDATCTGGSTDVACRLCGYDLALLELNKGTAYPTKQVPPALVPPLRKTFRAIGYGCQDAPTTAGGGCSKVGYRMFTDSAQVIEVDPQDFVISGRVCGGDSGGPVYDLAQNWIYGALSRGDGPTSTAEGCNYGIYTRTDFHSDWLQAQGAAAATRGGYTAPPWVTAVKPPPVVRDTGVDTGPPPPPGGLGAACTDPAQCTSGICVDIGDKKLCSQKCGTAVKCPAGYDCVGGYCIPGDPILPGDDAGPPPVDDDTGVTDPDASTGDPDVPDSTSSKGGCSIGAPGDGPPPRPQPWIAVSGLALAAVLVARRRR
jgi:hypothetical protein